MNCVTGDTPNSPYGKYVSITISPPSGTTLSNSREDVEKIYAGIEIRQKNAMPNRS